MVFGIPIPGAPSSDSDEKIKIDGLGGTTVASHFLQLGGKQAVYSGPHNTTMRRLWSIALYDLKNDEIFPIDKELDPRQEYAKAEFYFAVPPKVIDLTEPYSTNIVPTQNSGKFIESHGVIIREIRVQGTTGLRPSVGVSAFLDLIGNSLGIATAPVNALAGPIVNAAASAVDSIRSAFDPGYKIRGIPNDERTGHDDVMFLRNIFRLYSDLKKTNEHSSSVVMVWRNAKDGDYWIVEPKEFKIVQSSASPMLYNYTIQLRALTRFEQALSIPEDPLAALRSSQKFLSRVNSSTRVISNALLLISSQINRFVGLGIFVQNTLMAPMINVLEAARTIHVAARDAGPAWAQNWQRLEDSFEQAQRDVTNLDPERKIFPPQDPAINMLEKVRRATRRILVDASQRETLRSRFEERKKRIAGSFRINEIAGSTGSPQPETGGSKSFLGNERLGGSVKRAAVRPGDTIQTLAKRLLANRERWQMLATLNDLKAPYVSSAGGDKVLKPGEFIMYPVNSNDGLSTVEINPNDLEKAESGQNLDTPVERAYGRDIRLKSDGLNRSDIHINEFGDFSTVTGIPNVKQGIFLKFSTERGELTVHPYYGNQFPIGRKMDPISFNDFVLTAHATILSDARVSSIRRLGLVARGDTLSVGVELQLKQATDVLTTEFAIRSF